MNDEEILKRIEKLRKEHLEQYIPDIKFIISNGSPDGYFKLSKEIKNFDDMIIYLSECTKGVHDKDRDELLDKLKNFPGIEKPFDVTSLYELHKMSSMITLVDNFRGDFNNSFISIINNNGIYYDDIPTKFYHNNLMKFIDSKYKVISHIENVYTLVMQYKQLSTGRHIFTMHIDERIANIMTKNGYDELGKEGKLSWISDELYHFGACGYIKEWKY